VRYCCKPCQLGDWARHRADCKAWKAEADAAVVASGGCPLGDLKAQQAAIEKWRAPERTLAEIRKAAEGGNYAAQYALGACFNQGARGATKDTENELLWVQRAAAGNVATAQTHLGLMHKKGVGGLAVDHAEGARLYALAAAQGLHIAQYNLGICYRDGERAPLDLADAARLFRLGAEQGDTDAQSELGRAYMIGAGVTRDYDFSMLWARRAADKGDAISEHNVGLLFLNGWGVPRDPSSAASWFERAAKQGREESKQFLRALATEGVIEATAALHRLGEDAPLRAEDAAAVAAGRCPLGDLAAQKVALKRWEARLVADAQKAADEGDFSAQYALGICLMRGSQQCPKDESKAIQWLQRAASGNMAGALFLRGGAYSTGQFGSVIDVAKAAQFLSLAAAQGHGDAREHLLRLAAAGAGAPEYVAAVRRLGLAP